jgi:hypothetical protein
MDQVADANPVKQHEVGKLPIGATDDALLSGIIALPAEGGSVGPEGAIAPQRHSWTPRRYLALVAVGVAALAVGFVFLNGSGEPRSGTAPAYAEELVRFAESSPLVTMNAPGWRVVYADEETANDGEMQFQLGDKKIPDAVVTVHADGTETGMLPAATRQREASLNWSDEPIGPRKRDRAVEADISTTAPVLNTVANVYQYTGGSPGDRDITAIWGYDGLTLEYRSAVPDLAVFKQRLASLEAVDVDTWLGAMPASVLGPAGQSTQIAQMLEGIPLPDGFSADDVPTTGLTKDRYQLGAAVSGTVACTWFRDWAEARRDDDSDAVRKAVDAMATAKRWPVLAQMRREGDYPEVLIAYAAAMPSGKWYGRPLLGDVNSGLGCAHLGVPLGSN